jgi:hypothetical protein
VNLETLFNKVQESGCIKPSRLPHIRMSIRNYAGALGCPSIKDCPQEVFVVDKSTRNLVIEKHLSGKKSAHLLRNTKNDISFLLRQAEELNLIKLPELKLDRTRSEEISKHKLGRSLPRKVSPKDVGFHRTSYGLPLEKWHTHLREQYEDWKRWVSVDRVVVNGINPYNRPATIENKTNKLKAYFGYLFNIRRIYDLDLRMLLDVGVKGLAELDDEANFIFLRKNAQVGLLEEFANWHRERNNHKDSFQVSGILSVAASIAQKYYLPKALLDERYSDADKYSKIAAEINDLQERLNHNLEHNKARLGEDEQFVTAEDLRRAAEQEFPRMPLFENQSGTVLAQNAGRALAIMLLVTYPLRNVNYREARLSQNIIKRADGRWVLRFTGDDETASLKSKKRLNKPNIYEKVIESKIADYLDKYLSEWRPKLIQQIDNKIQRLKTENPDQEDEIKIFEEHKNYLFLNSRGVPFSRQTFPSWVEKGIYRWLGVRINPEKIRYISAIEMLQQGKDVTEIAAQLNDVPESILRIKSNYL